MFTIMKEKMVISAALIALSVFCLGWFIKAGIDDFASKDRKVNVKGLAEQEVQADKVTWPIVSKEVGNDLPGLYDRIGSTQAKIKAFLIKGGVKEDEISLNAPQVADLTAREYDTGNRAYRYIVTSVVTVTSKNVDLVRKLIAKQGDLLREGVAIAGDSYDNQVQYEFVAFKEENAQTTAEQFAKNSHSKLNKIVSADQGQFSIENRDEYTPWIKKVRVVTTVTYSLKN